MEKETFWPTASSKGKERHSKLFCDHMSSSLSTSKDVGIVFFNAQQKPPQANVS